MTEKRVAVINDLSGFGRCSLTASVPILSVMGLQPCPMPTAVLTNQTGFADYYCVDLTDELSNYIRVWSRNGESFDGIYSGYVAHERQLDLISEFFDVFGTDGTVILVDPVMGDNGELYPTFSRESCRKMRALASRADIITPNLTELCILAEEDYGLLADSFERGLLLEKISEIAKGCLSKRGQTIIVTGINLGGELYNGVISSDGADFLPAGKHRGSFSGTGDIFSSIVFADAVSGVSLKQSVKRAAEFIEMAIEDTVSSEYRPEYGVNFEKFLYLLAKRSDDNCT